MRVIIINRIAFEDWEKAYLTHLGYTKAQIRAWEECKEEIDPNIFSGKKAEGFRLGYDMARYENDHSGYNYKYDEDMYGNYRKGITNYGLQYPM